MHVSKPASTHLYLYLYYHCQLWLCGPQFKGVSQQEASGQGTPLAVGTHAPTPQPHGPLVQIGYSSVGLQDPRDERDGVQP